MKKTLSLLVLVCFLTSTVFSDLARASVERDRSAEKTAPLTENGVIPPGSGQITDEEYFGSPQLVVAIQDLHCHTEVQKNIAAILARLDAACGLKRVYVEGGHGPVDTSRLCDIPDPAVKREIIDDMLSRGTLTGSEYYSVNTGRPHLLQGLEDPDIHKANIVRLGRILEKKEYFADRVRELDRDIAFMQAKYFGARNKSFDRLVARHRKGKISAEKYFTLLLKYADRLNGITAVDRGDYPQIAGYLDLMRRARRLSYVKASRQLQALMGQLKSRIPYSDFRLLQESTGNFTRLEELYVRLPGLAQRSGIPLARQYPELSSFLEYTELSRCLNPVKLIQEDRRLTGEIRLGLSRSVSELEVSFLSDFYAYFQDYLLAKISAEDYRYFSERFDKFRLTWGKYAYKNRISEMAGDFELLDEYYRANTGRNNSFIQNIEELRGVPVAGKNVEAPVAGSLSGSLNNSEVVVVVAGGFHTAGLRALLRERRISCVTVTPRVTQETGAANAVYEQLAREQARILSQAMQLELASQLSSPKLVELALEAANTRLRDAGAGDRDRIVADLLSGMKVKASYDPAGGVITFDNGAQVKVDAGKGAVRLRSLKIAETLSPAVSAAAQTLIDTAGFSAAVVRGDAYVALKAILEFATNHYLITGNGLPYELENNSLLKARDEIDGIQKEVLARFPAPIAQAVADRQLRAFDLENAARRAGWMNVLLAVDLLRPVLPPPAPAEDSGQPVSLPQAPDGDEFQAAIRRIAEAGEISNGEIRGITDTYISKKYTSIPDDLRKERVRRFFAGLVVDGAKELSLNSFLKSGSIPRARVAFIEGIIDRIDAKARRTVGEEGAWLIGREIRSVRDILYRRMPDSLFVRFYKDTGILPAHSFEHALNVVEQICDLLSVESDEVIMSIDYRALVYAAIAHDISYMVFDEKHETNSALWFSMMLEREGNCPPALIEKIASIARGHEKVKDNTQPRQEHGLFEARLVHDADLLDAIKYGYDRIYDITSSPDHDPLFRDHLTVQERQELYRKPKSYDEGDGMQEFMRKAFVQRDPKFFLTAGARTQIVLNLPAGLRSLIDFLLLKQDEIRGRSQGGTRNDAPYDLTRMLDTVTTMYKVMTDSEKDVSSSTSRKQPAWQKFLPFAWLFRRDVTDRRRQVESIVFGSTGKVVEYFSDQKNIKEKMRLFPEIGGYLWPLQSDRGGGGETADSLRSHVLGRCFSEQLATLEALSTVKSVEGESNFVRDARRLNSFKNTGVMPYFRAALLYHDIAKGSIETDEAIDHAITNEASASILRTLKYPGTGARDVLRYMRLNDATSQKDIYYKLAYQLIAMRGLPGKFVRGEVNYGVFVPFTDWIQKNWNELVEALAPGNPRELPRILADMHYLFNMIDAVSAKENWWDDAPVKEYRDLFTDFQNIITPETKGKPFFRQDSSWKWDLVGSRSVQAHDRQDTVDNDRAELVGRLLKLRKSTIAAGEPPKAVAAMIDGLSAPELTRLSALLKNFVGWYIERASSRLSPESQLKLLAIAASLAERKGIDISKKPFHLHMGELARSIRRDNGEYDQAKLRQIERLLKPVSLSEILLGKGALLFDVDRSDSRQEGLVIRMAGGKAVHLNFVETGGTHTLQRTPGEAESIERLVSAEPGIPDWTGHAVEIIEDGETGSNSRTGSSLLLPQNRQEYEKMRFREDGTERPRWKILLYFATKEYDDTLRPGEFYRRHYQGPDAYRGGYVRRALGVGAIYAATKATTRFFGFIPAMVLAPKGSGWISRTRDLAVQYGKAVNIRVHAAYNMIFSRTMLILPSDGAKPDAAVLEEIISLALELQSKNNDFTNSPAYAGEGQVDVTWVVAISLPVEKIAESLNEKLCDLGIYSGTAFLRDPRCDVEAAIRALFGDTQRMTEIALDAEQEYQVHRKWSGALKLYNAPHPAFLQQSFESREQVEARADERFSPKLETLQASLVPFFMGRDLDYEKLIRSMDEKIPKGISVRQEGFSIRQICDNARKKWQKQQKQPHDVKLMLPKHQKMAQSLRAKGIPEKWVQVFNAVIELPRFIPMAFWGTASAILPSLEPRYDAAVDRWVGRHGDSQSELQITLRHTGTDLVVYWTGPLFAALFALIIVAPPSLLLGIDLRPTLILTALLAATGLLGNIASHVRWNLDDDTIAADAQLMLPDTDAVQAGQTDTGRHSAPPISRSRAADLMAVAIRSFNHGPATDLLTTLSIVDMALQILESEDKEAGGDYARIRREILDVTVTCRSMVETTQDIMKTRSLTVREIADFEINLQRAVNILRKLKEKELDPRSLQKNAPQYLQAVANRVTSAIMILENRLQFARGALPMKKIDLNDVVEKACRLEDSKVMEYRDLVVVRHSDAPVEVEGDEFSLLNSIANCIVNAGEAARDAKIPLKQGDIEISVERQGEFAVLAIRDRSGGIPERLMKQDDHYPDEPDRPLFFRIGETTKSTGTGIGTPETWETIRLHGGSTEVSVLPGVGTTFTFKLPLATKHAGFGLAMNTEYSCSEAEIEKHKKELLGRIDRAKGRYPEDFRLEKITSENGAPLVEVLVHRKLLERLGPYGSVQNLYNTAMFDWDRQDLSEIEHGLRGKLIVLDVVPRSPNLYGNCNRDGYIYINEQAPARLDPLGFMHALRHETGISDGIDENALAEQDMAVLVKAGLGAVLSRFLGSSAIDAAASPLHAIMQRDSEQFRTRYGDEFSGMSFLKTVDLDEEVSRTGLDRIKDPVTGMSRWDRIQQYSAGVQTIYEFIDSLDKYASEDVFLLGRSSLEYETISKAGGLCGWVEAHERFFGNIRVQTDRFMARVCSESRARNKRIVFFVPSGINADKKAITAQELEWLLKRPAYLKQVVFVFGADGLIENNAAYIQKFTYPLRSFSYAEKQAIHGQVLLNYRNHLKDGAKAPAVAPAAMESRQAQQAAVGVPRRVLPAVHAQESWAHRAVVIAVSIAAICGPVVLMPLISQLFAGPGIAGAAGGIIAAVSSLATMLKLASLINDWQDDRARARSGIRTVCHIVRHSQLGASLDRYPDSDDTMHLWVTDVPPQGLNRWDALPLDIKASIPGENSQRNLWLETKGNALIFYVGNGDVSAGAADEVLAVAAAQITAHLGGTDLLKGDSSAARSVRRDALLLNTRAKDFTFKPAMVVDHFNEPGRVKRAFSDAAINTVSVVSSAELDDASPAIVNDNIRKRIIRHEARKAAWGENKIIRMDVDGLPAFRQALKVFNTVGNGQMLISWDDVFRKALDGKKITEAKIRALLANARQHGVAVHFEYKATAAGDVAAVKKIFALGFNGVSLDVSGLDAAAADALLKALSGYPLLAVKAGTGVRSPVPKRTVRLDEAVKEKFSPDDVIEIVIPEGMSREEIRDCFAKLSSVNTTIFHSRDAAAMVGASRDIIDKKLLVSLIDLLVSFGKQEIITPDQARRLAMRWPVDELPELLTGDRREEQLRAMAAGDLYRSGVAFDSAVYDEAVNLDSRGLAAAFLSGIAARMLIVERLRQTDRSLADAYVSGKYRFSNPQWEAMLGDALLRQAALTPEAARQDTAAAELLKSGAGEDTQSLVARLHAGIGNNTVGAATAVADIILLDVLTEFRMRRTVDYAPGKLETQQVKLILSAA